MEKSLKSAVETARQRVDAYLAKTYPGFSRGYFQKLIDKGDVRVNGKTVSRHHMVKINDEVEFLPLSQDKTALEENIPVKIIHEDGDILVINKAQGMVVHPACGHPTGTLINALYGYAKGGFVPYLVHRLDKDTSGVMIVAKNERSKNILIKQFQRRDVKKTYIVMVKGCVNEDKGRIVAPLGRSPLDRKKIVVGPNAKKDAVTEFKVLKRGREFSSLEAFPLTGRTHQIRSHMAYIGHPVLGDSVYDGPESIGDLIFPRQMLHARKISIIHPGSNKRVEFECELPQDMKNLV